MERVVLDITHDFAVKPRLSSEWGNAILVASGLVPCLLPHFLD